MRTQSKLLDETQGGGREVRRLELLVLQPRHASLQGNIGRERRKEKDIYRREMKVGNRETVKFSSLNFICSIFFLFSLSSPFTCIELQLFVTPIPIPLSFFLLVSSLLSIYILIQKGNEGGEEGDREIFFVKLHLLIILSLLSLFPVSFLFIGLFTSFYIYIPVRTYIHFSMRDV